MVDHLGVTEAWTN